MARTEFPNYTTFKIELDAYLEPGQGARPYHFWENVGAFNHAIWKILNERSDHAIVQRGWGGTNTVRSAAFFPSDFLRRKVESHLDEMTSAYESKMRKGRARTVMQLMIGQRRWYFVLSTGSDNQVIVWHWPVSEKMRDVLDLVETPFT